MSELPNTSGLVQIGLNHFKDKCEHCHKGFDEEENFKRHIELVHEVKKPYKREHCQKGFDEEENFKRHNSISL